MPKLHFFMAIESYFNRINDKITSEIEAAELSIIVVVAWITDRKIIKALLEKLNQEIEVKILINQDQFNDEEKIGNLISGFGPSIRKTEHHHKFCIIDYSIVISGSYNWTHSASNKIDQENIIISRDSSIVVKDYLKIFTKLWGGAFFMIKGKNYKKFNTIGSIERLELPDLEVDVTGKRFYRIGDYNVYMDERIRNFEYRQELLMVQYKMFNNNSVFILTLPDMPPYESLPIDYYTKLTTKEFVEGMRKSSINKYLENPW